MSEKKISANELEEVQDILKVKRQRVRKEQYQSGISEARSARQESIGVKSKSAGTQRRGGTASPIMNQSAKSRRMRQKETPTELEELHRGEGKRSFRIKKRKKSGFKIFLRNALICIILYAIIMPTSYLLFRRSLKTAATVEKSNIVYQIGDDSNIFLRKTLSYDSVISDDTVYLNMSELASYCEMMITGDSEQLRFIVRDGSNENVGFVIGSDEVKINNVSARLSAPTFVKDGSLYVPMEFVNLYVIGVKATYDTEKSRLTVAKDPDAGAVSFALKAPTPTEAISWDSLSYDLRELIMNGNRTDNGSSGAESVTDIDNKTVTGDGQQGSGSQQGDQQGQQGGQQGDQQSGQEGSQQESQQ